MKKKVVLGVALAAILTTGTAFAEGFGIGVHGGFGGIGGGAGLNLAFSGMYLYIDGLSASNNNFAVSGALDFMSLFHDEFVDTLSFYIRLGVGASLWTWSTAHSDGLGVAAGLRLPIGLSWRPIDLLELFVQLVPQVGLRFAGHDANVSNDATGYGGFRIWSNFWGANLGLRIWL